MCIDWAHNYIEKFIKIQCLYKQYFGTKLFKMYKYDVKYVFRSELKQKRKDFTADLFIPNLIQVIFHFSSRFSDSKILPAFWVAFYFNTV